MRISTKILLFVSVLALLAVGVGVALVMIENNVYIDETNMQTTESGLSDLQNGINDRMKTTGTTRCCWPGALP